MFDLSNFADHVKMKIPVSQKFLSKRISLSSLVPFDCLAADRRPLLEGRSSSYSLDDNSYKHCPYADSRLDTSKPMNIGALVLFQKYRTDIMSIFSELSQTINAVNFTYPKGTPSILNIWCVAFAARHLPISDFLLHRHIGTPKPEVHGAIAAAFKFSLGLLDTIFSAVLGNVGVGECLSAEELYRVADSRHRLVGLREVCPAPPAMIINVLTELFDAITSPATRGRLVISHANINGSFSRFLETKWQIHQFALLFDTARIFFLQNKPDSSFEKPAVDVRHASVYATEAIRAASLPNPKFDPYLGAMMKLGFLENTFYLDPTLTTLRDFVYTEIFQRKFDGREITGETYFHMESIAIDFLNNVEINLIEYLNFPKNWERHTYKQVDLNYFFGAAL